MQLIAGGLGSGKTTLLRHLLQQDLGRVAVIVNEFGQIGIDGQLLEGERVRLVELPGGCVCCSLAGEFAAAVEELIVLARPDLILVEATGVAEADALVLDIEERLSQIRLEAVIAVVDADVCRRFPRMGYAERAQVESADLLVVNKIDLVDTRDLEAVEQRLRECNARAALVRTCQGRLDPHLLGGWPPAVPHPAAVRAGGDFGHAMSSFTWEGEAELDQGCFEAAVASWPDEVYRAKGFVRLSGGTWLFNYVAGRWQLEPAPGRRPALVWIGPQVDRFADRIREGMIRCAARGYEFLDDVAIADVAFRAWGRTPEEVFQAACGATMRVMVEDLDSIRRQERRPLVRREARAEMLLFDLLQELVYYKDAEGLLLLPEEIRVEIGEGESRLQACLVGEKLEPGRHPLKLDVKAVTLHRFALRRTVAGWEAEVVLDI